MKFTGKNIVVTAASTGIGRAIAIAFGKEGAHVLLVARRRERLEETRKMVEDAGGSAEIFVVDLSNIDSINGFLSNIRKSYRKIDVICNIAGIWHGEGVVYAGKEYETFNQKVIVDTYMVGTVAPSLLVQGLLPLMPRGSSIMNLSGTFESGAKGWLPYYVSKHAIEDLTIALSQELDDKRIRSNGISPSDVATEEYAKYFPEYIPDAIEPEKIAEYAVFLCSEDASNINGKIYVLKKDKDPFEAFHY